MKERVKKEFWIKERTWTFLTKLCHCHLFKDIKTLCMHYQKWSQAYTEGKNKFLRYEDWRDSWDLKYIENIIQSAEINFIVVWNCTVLNIFLTKTEPKYLASSIIFFPENDTNTCKKNTGWMFFAHISC